MPPSRKRGGGHEPQQRRERFGTMYSPLGWRLLYAP